MKRAALPLALLALLGAAAARAQAEPAPGPGPASTPASLLPPEPAAAPEPPPPPPPPPFAARGGPDPGSLDAAIDETLRSREFSWRLPPERNEASAPRGWLDRFFDSITRWVRRTWEAIGRAFKKFRDWWEDLFPKKPVSRDLPDLPRADFAIPPRTLLYILLGAAGVIAVWLAVRLLRRRREAPVTGEAAPAAAIDLTKEETTADQLPEAGWSALARELAARGDYRLALRALYLASLADLGGRGHVTLSRAKSNLEYRRELERRARHLESLRAAFAENLLSFEEVWYGARGADAARLDRFAANLERMRDGS